MTSRHILRPVNGALAGAVVLVAGMYAFKFFHGCGLLIYDPACASVFTSPILDGIIASVAVLLGWAATRLGRELPSRLAPA